MKNSRLLQSWMLTKMVLQLRTKWYSPLFNLNKLYLQSKLTIVKDKSKDILGEADLNLSDYAENEYKILRLSLRKCDDPNAYIEVGLRGTVAAERGQTPKPNDTSKDQLVSLL